jgi:hypothetical protein
MSVTVHRRLDLRNFARYGIFGHLPSPTSRTPPVDLAPNWRPVRHRKGRGIGM